MNVPEELSERLARRIRGYRDEMVTFQCHLTAIQALGPEGGGEGEWVRSRYLLERLREFGVSDVREFDAPDGRVPGGLRPNLVARVGGHRVHPAVWVMAHMDTVPPGELSLWETDPFEAVVKDGKVFGRGTEDNQQGLTAALFALRALVDEGLTPTTDAAVLLVADEENGNTFGIDYLLQARPTWLARTTSWWCRTSGSLTAPMLEVAEKSILWGLFEVHGRQVHASVPADGINAHRAAANLAVRLDERLHARFAASDQLFDPSGSTFEPTKREANVPNVNTIPGEDRFYFDCRVLPGYPLADVKVEIESAAAEIEAEFGVTVEVSYPNQAPAAPATSADAPVVLTLAEAVRQVRGVEPYPMGMGGGTVAAVFRRRGIPAVAWGTMQGLAHQPNECCDIDNMVADSLVFAHLFMRADA